MMQSDLDLRDVSVGWSLRRAGTTVLVPADARTAWITTAAGEDRRLSAPDAAGLVRRLRRAGYSARIDNGMR